MRNLLFVLPMIMVVSNSVCAEKWTDPISGITWTYQIGDDGVSIGGGSWQSTAVSASIKGTVRVPSEINGYVVRNIGAYAFFDCEEIVSVVLPSSVTSIGKGAFQSCGKLEDVTLPSSVTNIGEDAFFYCEKITEMEIPASVREIGESAFDCCRGLETVTLHSGLKKIGENAFWNCSRLKSVNIDDLVSWCGVVFANQRSNPLNDYQSSCRLIVGGVEIVDLVVPNEVERINSFAFYGYDSLKSLTLQSGTKEIGQGAFMDCGQLNKVSFVDGVESIGMDAFFGCRDLTSISFPLSVTNIGNGAFYATGIKRVGVPPSVKDVTWIEERFPSDCEIVLQKLANVMIYGKDSVKCYDGFGGKFDVVVESDNDFYDDRSLCRDILFSPKDVGLYTETMDSFRFVNTNLYYAVKIEYGRDATVKILFGKIGMNGGEPGEGDVPQGGLSKFDVVTTYDGTGHTIDTNALKDVTLVADTPVFSYSLTSNGVFRAEPYLFTKACVTSVWYKISATNYEDYVHEARVTILPREVTLTSGTAQKKYDGVALTNGELNVGGDGFVGEEGVTWTCTGSQTEVGSSENTFEYAFKDGTLASNYNITKQYGTLTVEYAGVTSSPQILPSEFFGDSGEVTIDCEMTDAVIRYTLDGTVPTETSAIYEGPITIPAKNAATVVRAIAVRHGWMPSGVAEQRIVSLTPPDGSGNAVTNAAAVCHADNAGVLDVTYDVAGNSSSNRQKVEVVVSVCGTNLAYVVADGSVSDLGAAGRHTVTVDFSSVLNAAKGYSYVVKVGGCSVEVPNWAEGKEGLLVKDNWVYGHTDSTIKELEIPDGVVGIAAGAFAGFAELETVSLPLTLRRICDNAFTMDTRLTSIVLPEGLKFIGEEAFYGCTKMANVIVPGSVKSVGSRAFRQCTALTNAQIAYGVESIGDECFYSDWRISEVDLPSTVTNIGREAFGGDSSIIRAGLRCDVRKMSEIFSNYRHIREIIVKEGDGEIVAGCFKDCEELKDVRYMGNCPALEEDGRELYANTFASNGLTLVSYVLPESTGWDGIEASDQLPQAWPLVGGYRRPIAHWDVPTYLCRFDSNGGTLGVQDTYQYSEQGVVLPPEPVQSGYKFAGWWTQPVGGLRVTEKTIFIEGVYTYLWAHWLKGHTVFLDPNGGVVINGFVTYVEESVYGVLPTPVRSGYAFGGWLFNSEKIEPDTEINEKADHTLVAQWIANAYKVKYHPNGGSGNLVMEDWTYGETKTLRCNSFVRAGYDFMGWATVEGGVAIYRDSEPVSNLTVEAGAVVELWAVWRESAATDPTNVELSFGGESDWTVVHQLVEAEEDGRSICTPVFWQSGKIADNEQSSIKAKVFGAGTIRFWWRVDCEKFRDYKLDHLSFSVDGVEKAWINGITEWAFVEYEVTGVTEHEFVWSYVKDGQDSDAADNGAVCAIVWTPRLETLEDYAGATNVVLTTGGDAGWFGVTNVVHNQSGSLRSGKIGDGQQSRMEATVAGEGFVEFWWKTDCESFRTYKIDHVSFYVDGVEQAWTNGVTDWARQSFKVSGSGPHKLVWTYEKDAEGSSGEDCAWVSEVSWRPSGEALARPTIEGDEGAMVTGDAETGFVIKPSEGKTAVEVTIPKGVDAAKVTVKVSTKVASVKPNGAKVKIVSGGADITEYLDIPGTTKGDDGGVVATQETIDLTKATVKEEIVKEAMDVEKGAVIDLSGGSLGTTSPTITTAPTHVGLFYTFSEGRTLGGMERSDSKVGDGQPWSPEIKVKGGSSAFYSIGVDKGE